MAECCAKMQNLNAQPAGSQAREADLVDAFNTYESKGCYG